MFKNNKRADGSVVLLVVLTLIVSVISLFIFLTQGNKITASFSELSNIEVLSAEREIFMINLKTLGEIAVSEIGSGNVETEFVSKFTEAYSRFSNGVGRDLFEKYAGEIRKAKINNQIKILKKDKKLSVTIEDFEFINEKDLNFIVKQKEDLTFEIDL